MTNSEEVKMENKPTLRERAAGIEEQLDDFNSRYGRSDKLCHFCASSKYDGKSGIIHTPDCLILTLRSFPSLLKAELDGLAVIGNEEIIELVTKYHFSGVQNRHVLAKQIAQSQLSHTKDEIKKLLEVKE